MGDWSSSIYIASQVFVVLGFVCIFATYQIKSRSKLLATSIASSLLMGVSFILLNAWVGLAMCCVAICRDVVSEIFNRQRSEATRTKNTGLDWLLLIIWTTALISLTVITENGWVTWFALFGTLTFTVSIWQKNALLYRLLGIFVGIFWIIYYTGIESLFGIILEAILLVGVIIGLVRFIVKARKNQSEMEEK
jgi:hypothetical protein